MPARLFLRGKPGKQTWWVDLGKIRGTRRRVSLHLPKNHRAEAEAVASTLVLRRAMGGDSGLLATLQRMRSTLSFKEAWEDARNHALAQGLSETTIARYDASWRRLSAAFGVTVSLHDIGDREITKYRGARLEAGASPNTVNAELITLSAIFTRAHELGHGDRRKIKLIKVHEQAERVLNQDEIDRYLAACCPWYQCAAILAIDTGARIRSEILSLTRDQIDLERAQLRIAGKKVHLRRSVPLSESAVLAIERQAKAAPFGKWVFPSAETVDGDTRSAAGHVMDVRHVHAEALRDSKVPAFTPHAFRHTWATRLMETGKVSLRTLQQLGGWASLRMVERYSHVEEAAKRRAIDSLPALRVAQVGDSGEPQKVRRARRIAKFPGVSADE